MNLLNLISMKTDSLMRVMDIFIPSPCFLCERLPWDTAYSHLQPNEINIPSLNQILSYSLQHNTTFLEDG